MHSDIQSSLLNVLPDALCVISADGRLCFANRAFSALFGHSSEDLAGQNWDWLWDAPGASPLIVDEGSGTGAAEPTTPLCWSVLRRDPCGTVYLSVRVDDQDCRVAEHAAFIDALAEDDEGQVVKARFLANVSHEIRTPMNGIVGVAQLLNEAVTDPEVKKLARLIQENSESLLAVLNDVLDFSKIDAERMTLEAIPFELGDLARRVASLHELAARGKQLEFSLVIADDVPDTWLGDPGKLLQICNNLTSNALKFTESGSIRIGFDRTEDAGLKLSVHDTGIGMSEEEQDRVFEAFSQADTSTTRRYGGTGLGLSIVKGLVAAMGGQISLKSAPGKGTSITVDLPLVPSPDGMAARDGGRHAVALPRGLRILAVDDSATNLMVLCAHLKRFGAEVVSAGGGREAVKQAGLTDFDLYLFDIAMPDLDGPDALATIRRDERARKKQAVPAIAVTAHSLPHQVEEFLAMGFAAHVPKPFTRQELYTALAEVVAEARFGATTRIAS
ncbi:MAG: ATP-binding protein [Pseudomonadota bacterium]